MSIQIKERQIKRFGWKRSLPDFRDFMFKAVAPVPLPPKVDLRPSCPPIYDQGNLGSCTANALNGLFEFDLLKQGKTDFMPSRLFVYYNERLMEGTIKEDAGAEIKDGIKSMNKVGVCTEKIWPYILNKFDKKPPKKCYTQAAKNMIKLYEKVDNTSEFNVKQSIAKGFPFALGFSVFESFDTKEVEQSGIMPVPKAGETLLGGHAVACVGYDDAAKMYIIRNSWGESWGKKGYFFMPYEVMHNADMVADCWNITLVP